MVDFALSMTDLELIDGFSSVIENSLEDWASNYRVEEDVERHVFVECPYILAHLWRNGMDIKYPIEVVVRQHRNLHNQVVRGPRFEGQERTDPAWIDTGCASLDAIIASTSDSSMRFTLRAMSVEGTNDRGFD